jgi:hypothetical protein
LHEEALAVWREFDDSSGLIYALWRFGFALIGGDDHRAERVSQACAALATATGERCMAGAAVGNLACLDRCRGNPQRAIVRLSELLPLVGALGWPQGIAATLMLPGEAANDRGDAESATGYLAEAREVWGTARCLDGVATALARADAVAAARLFGAGSTFRRATTVRRLPAEDALVAAIVAGLRAELGEDGFASAWAAGEALAFDQVIAVALAATSEPRTVGG